MKVRRRTARVTIVMDIARAHATGGADSGSESSPVFVGSAEHGAGVKDGDSLPVIHDEDQWALDWIDISRLQAISEAFDDDASGFVTISEVNHLTSSRPTEWRYLLR